MISDFEKKYKIKGKISEGAFGQIYIIEDKKVNTEYVLKKIMKKDPENIVLFEFEDFEKEIVNLKEIKGTNIINIIDYYYDDNFYYIIAMLGFFKKRLPPTPWVRKIIKEKPYTPN